MKTLIIIREQEYEWLHPVFPGIHPLLIPICNKPYIEFLIDFAILAGSGAMRIVSDGPISDIEEYCDNGNRWGISLSYASILSSDDLRAVIEKNQRYCSEERVMIINGFVFIGYDKHNSYKTLFSSLPEGDFLTCSHGSISLTGAPSQAQNPIVSLPLSLVGLDSIHVYYHLCTDILNDVASPYVLPGYSNEEGCHIGRNVVISKSAEIKKPVIIGNNVQILADSVIGPGAVIGSDVIIDRESTVTGSIVLDNTYIGEHLEVINRIAAGNILIEPESGVSIAMEDPHLFTGTKKSGSATPLVLSLVHSLEAILLIALQLIPFLLLSSLLSIQGKWKTSKTSYYTAVAGKILTLTTVAIERKGVLSTIAAALSLDRFILLFSVLRGQLAIIGSYPIVANADTSRTLNGMESWYRAGVFSYAEAEDWPASGGDKAIVERYFAVHGNPLLDIAMTVKALLNRIHETNTP